MQNQGTKFIEHAKKEEKPPAPEAGQEELAKKVKEARFIDRVALLGFKSAEMTDKDISKLRAINDKIEEIDAPWVVRVMDRLQRENLLDSFKPEDVEKLQKIAQEKGYDFEKQGIVSGQAKELVSAFKEGRRAEDWQKTFESGGTRTKERIEAASVSGGGEETKEKTGEGTEELTKTLPKGPSLQEGPAPDRTWVFKAQTAEDAPVFIEARQKDLMQRFDCGTVGSFKVPQDTALTDVEPRALARDMNPVIDVVLLDRKAAARHAACAGELVVEK